MLAGTSISRDRKYGVVCMVTQATVGAVTTSVTSYLPRCSLSHTHEPEDLQSCRQAKGARMRRFVTLVAQASNQDIKYKARLLRSALQVSVRLDEKQTTCRALDRGWHICCVVPKPAGFSSERDPLTPSSSEINISAVADTEGCTLLCGGYDLGFYTS